MTKRLTAGLAASAQDRPLKPLLEIHAGKHGKVSDKWAAYFPVYERALGSRRQQEVALLEIGVQNGGSLEVWAAYFEHARVVVGCDIDPRCSSLSYDDSRIHVVVGDATTQSTEQRILSLAPAFDLIIDDGSHVSDDVLRAFLIYFEHVKPGGLYIVEDTHTLFWEAYGGGVLKRNSAHDFFKLLADLVNLEHWSKELSVGTLFAPFILPSAFPKFLEEGWIESVEFSNSMIVVRKSDACGGSRLGARLVCGDVAAVDPRPLALVGRIATGFAGPKP
ncbi:MAG: class I SAM-dependent methyltransferase [Pseudomonadota bacterium]|nr:class I SAM-dependent methyltransferase [Pseudomonadota bacterium]